MDVAKHPIVTDLGEGVYGHSLIPKHRVHRVRLVDQAVIQGDPYLPGSPPNGPDLFVELVVLAPVVHAVVHERQVVLNLVNLRISVKVYRVPLADFLDHLHDRRQGVDPGWVVEVAVVIPEDYVERGYVLKLLEYVGRCLDPLRRYVGLGMGDVAVYDYMVGRLL